MLLKKTHKPNKLAVDFFNKNPPRRFEKTSQFFPTSPEPLKIPENYGDHKIVLLVRDPWMLFVYWELNQEILIQKEKLLRQKDLIIQRWIIRLYHEVQETKFCQEIELTIGVNHWYIPVSHDNIYYVEIGIIASDQSFYSLAMSNKAETPHFGLSPAIDSDWKCSGEEYWHFFALSGGFGVGTSSLESREIFLQRMTQWLTSGETFLSQR